MSESQDSLKIDADELDLVDTDLELGTVVEEEVPLTTEPNPPAPVVIDAGRTKGFLEGKWRNRLGKMKDVALMITILTAGVVLSTDAVLKAQREKREYKDKRHTDAEMRKQIRAEEMRVSHEEMLKYFAARREEHIQTAAKEWESAEQYAEAGDVKGVQECLRVINIFLGKTITREDIQLSEERERDTWKKAATRLWEDMKCNLSVERLGDFYFAVECAGCAPEEIDATEDEINTLYLARAKKAWEETLLCDRQGERSSLWSLHEMLKMLKAAGMSSEAIGVKQDLIDQVLANVERRTRGERPIPVLGGEHIELEPRMPPEGSR